MVWTSPADLRAQVQKLWDKGVLLAQRVSPHDSFFPLRLKLATPSSTDLATRFAEVRLWAAYNLGLGKAGRLDVAPMFRYNSARTFSYTAPVALSAQQIAADPGYARRPTSQTADYRLSARASRGIRRLHDLQDASLRDELHFIRQ